MSNSEIIKLLNEKEISLKNMIKYLQKIDYMNIDFLTLQKLLETIQSHNFEGSIIDKEFLLALITLNTLLPLLAIATTFYMPIIGIILFLLEIFLTRLLLNNTTNSLDLKKYHNFIFQIKTEIENKKFQELLSLPQIIQSDLEQDILINRAHILMKLINTLKYSGYEQDINIIHNACLEYIQLIEKRNNSLEPELTFYPYGNLPFVIAKIETKINLEIEKQEVQQNPNLSPEIPNTYRQI